MVNMGSPMQKGTFRVLAYILIFNATAFLEAVSRSPCIEIVSGGYQFKASFALHKPASPEELIVNMSVVRSTHFAGLTAHTNVPTGAGPLDILLSIKDKPTIVGIEPQRSGHHKIHGIYTDSVGNWYPKIKKIAASIGSAYHGVDNYKVVVDNHRKYGVINYHQKSCKQNHRPKTYHSSMNIKPVGNCKLSTGYCLRVTSHEHRRLPLSGHLIVAVTTQMIRGAQGKKELCTEVSFYKKEQVAFDSSHPRPVTLGVHLHAAKNDSAAVDFLSVLRFVNTKKGLKLAFSNDIDRSSIWYSSVKKAAERSVQLYLALAQSYDEIFKKTKNQKVKCTSRAPHKPNLCGNEP